MAEHKDLLVVKNLHVTYQRAGSSTPIQALGGVELSVYANEIVGLAGESGCGKSTLLKVLYGMTPRSLRVTSGEITLYADGKEHPLIRAASPVRNERLRWKVMSYIPQSSMSVLNPVVSIGKQFSWVIRRHAKLNERRAAESIKTFISRLDLPARVLQSYPHQLSGGMRQRVVIAMATLLHPTLVLADEPTTGLDVVVQRSILELLQEIQREFHMTLLIVSHDMGIHYQITDRTAVMYAGNIVEVAPTETLFKRPRHPYTYLLIASLPRLGDSERREGIRGTPPNLASPPSGCRFHPRCPYALEVCKVEMPPLREVRPGHFVACHQAEELDFNLSGAVRKEAPKGATAVPVVSEGIPAKPMASADRQT